MQQWCRQLCCDSSHLEMVGYLTETSLWFPSGFFQRLIVWPVLSSPHSPVKEINKQTRPSLGQSNHLVGWCESAVITHTHTFPSTVFTLSAVPAPEVVWSADASNVDPDLWFRCLRWCIFLHPPGMGALMKHEKSSSPEVAEPSHAPRLDVSRGQQLWEAKAAHLEILGQVRGTPQQQ